MTTVVRPRRLKSIGRICMLLALGLSAIYVGSQLARIDLANNTLIQAFTRGYQNLYAARTGAQEPRTYYVISSHYEGLSILADVNEGLLLERTPFDDLYALTIDYASLNVLDAVRNAPGVKLLFSSPIICH